MAFTQARLNTKSPKITVEAIIAGKEDKKIFLKSDEDAEPVAVDRHSIKILKNHPGYSEIRISESLAIQKRLI